MADKTKIANRILAKVGSRRINDFNDPILTQARKIRDVWDLAFEELLGEGNWTSHRERTSLTQLLATPDHKWAFQYQLPPNFVDICELNQLDVIDLQYSDVFDIEGDKLLTDVDTVSICFIQLSTDESKLTPSMVGALVDLVASELAISLRQDEALSLQLRAHYDDVSLPKALRLSTKRKKTKQWDPTAESRLVRARTRGPAG